jgi:hypothetical protein
MDLAGNFLREAGMPIVRSIDVTMQSEISLDDAQLQKPLRPYVG